MRSGIVFDFDLVLRLIKRIYLSGVIKYQNGGDDSAQQHVVTKRMAFWRNPVLVDTFRCENKKNIQNKLKPLLAKSSSENLTERNQEQHQRTEDSVNHAFHKLSGIEQLIGQPRRVKLWIFDAMLVRHVLLKDSEPQHRQ